MTAEQLQQIEEQGGIVDLSSRAKFRLTGTDRIRYLNGQVTNDARQASPDRTLYACVTDAKGKIQADVFIHASPEGDALFVDAEPGLRDALGPRLERYIIADDVELTDVTEEHRMWHVFGPAASAVQPGALRSERLGMEGVDLWSPTPPQVACPVLTETEFESLRVIRGIPRYPQELNGDTFPPEAGIESRAISYTKGCYIGQEVLSRIRTTGKMPRQLVQWRSKALIEAGEHLFAGDSEGKLIGSITSVAWHPSNQCHTGMGFVRQGSVALHSKLPAGPDQPRIHTTVEIFAFVN